MLRTTWLYAIALVVGVGALVQFAFDISERRRRAVATRRLASPDWSRKITGAPGTGLSQRGMQASNKVEALGERAAHVGPSPGFRMTGARPRNSTPAAIISTVPPR